MLAIIENIDGLKLVFRSEKTKTIKGKTKDSLVIPDVQKWIVGKSKKNNDPRANELTLVCRKVTL